MQIKKQVSLNPKTGILVGPPYLDKMTPGAIHLNHPINMKMSHALLLCLHILYTPQYQHCTVLTEKSQHDGSLVHCPFLNASHIGICSGVLDCQLSAPNIKGPVLVAAIRQYAINISPAVEKFL